MPAPGTRLSAALLAEADELARSTAVPESLAVGFGAGRDAFLRGLRARAEVVRASGDDVRPAPPRGADRLDQAPPAVPPLEPSGAEDPQAALLTLLHQAPDAVALPPAERE